MDQFKRYLSRSLLKSSKSCILLGPRQVGKSTLIKSLKPDLEINLADQVEYREFLANPNELRERIGLKLPKTVFVDEIQRLPELLNTIQAIIDERSHKIKFYLSGSSARKLKRGQANLLPGRVFSYRLGPVCSLELDFKLNSKKALELGCLPEPYLLKNRSESEKLLRTYTATYLKEEILAETMIRDLHGFSSFLTVAAENSGYFLDFSKLATKSKIHRSAARRYYEILEDTLICDRLESYADKLSEDLAKKMVKHPKYYFFDVGIVNGILENFSASADRVGRLFEHLFFNQVRSLSYCLDRTIPIWHFRTLSGQEIDFIIQAPSKIFCIELKAKEPSDEQVHKLESISKELIGDSETLVLCLDCKSKMKSKTKILPWQEGLKLILNALD